MTEDEALTLRLITTEIKCLSAEDRQVALVLAKSFRAMVKAGGNAGVLALALVGAQLQAGVIDDADL